MYTPICHGIFDRRTVLEDLLAVSCWLHTSTPAAMHCICHGLLMQASHTMLQHRPSQLCICHVCACRFTVRVMVPCYAEPLSVVSATIAAAMEADLPPGKHSHRHVAHDSRCCILDVHMPCCMQAPHRTAPGAGGPRALQASRVHSCASVHV
jgi:hypothetical protein